MDLHPHLHLLVPSDTKGVELEARLYISRELLDRIPKSEYSGVSTSSASTPIPAGTLSDDVERVLKDVDRLVIASHPWGHFGGNMLYP
jgi:hypothetical protein